MISKDKMKQEAINYTMHFNEDFKHVSFTNGRYSDWIKLSYKRAIEWVEAGVQDLDCRSKKEMLELLNQWIKEKGVK